jgi:cytochrome c-type biogenesis protein
MDPVSLGVIVAFTAGLLSFLSPCVLPLIPSYATFITGMSLSELRGDDADAFEMLRRRRTVLTHGLLFVSGFTLVFMLLGAGATLLGAMFAYYSVWVERVGGVLLIAFGILLLGWMRLPGAERDWRLHIASKPVGYAGTFFVGIAFGAGWTPCLGPVLGGILTLAATRESLAEGMGLLAMYSAGLAVPFLLATVALQHFLSAFARFRHWLPWVNRVSGVLLIVLGILLLTGTFSWLAALLTRYTPQFLLERL